MNSKPAHGCHHAGHRHVAPVVGRKETFFGPRISPARFPQQLLHCGHYEPACQGREFLIRSPRGPNIRPWICSRGRPSSATPRFSISRSLISVTGSPEVSFARLIAARKNSPTSNFREALLNTIGSTARALGKRLGPSTRATCSLG